MGIFDKAREAPQERTDKIDPLVGRVAAESEQRSGGQHNAEIDRAADVAEDKLGDQARRETRRKPGTPA